MRISNVNFNVPIRVGHRYEKFYSEEIHEVSIYFENNLIIITDKTTKVCVPVSNAIYFQPHEKLNAK